MWYWAHTTGCSSIKYGLFGNQPNTYLETQESFETVFFLRKECCENDAKWKTLYDVHHNNKAKEMTGYTSTPMFVNYLLIKIINDDSTFFL